MAFHFFYSHPQKKPGDGQLSVVFTTDEARVKWDNMSREQRREMVGEARGTFEKGVIDSGLGVNDAKNEAIFHPDGEVEFGGGNWFYCDQKPEEYYKDRGVKVQNLDQGNTPKGRRL